MKIVMVKSAASLRPLCPETTYKIISITRKNEQKVALRSLANKIELQKQVIDNKEELLITQRKYISELEFKSKLLGYKLRKRKCDLRPFPFYLN